MPKIPLVGPSYVYRSVNFDAQRSVNLYPVKSETGDSKAISALVTAPGLASVIAGNPNLGPARGAHVILSRCFFVAGGTLYEFFSDNTYTARGALLTITGLVSMDNNTNQIVLVDGPNGYVFNTDTNVFVQITSPAWLGADTVTFIDGYFAFNKPNSGIYYISAINDGSSFDSLDFATAEGSPDNLVGVKNVHKQLWLFGTNSVEVAYDSGNGDFPFQPIEGVFIEYGCAAPGSIASTANTVFWLGQDDKGQGIVWMATGYQPQRISTFAVEYAIQQYGVISDAVGYTYQEDGHYFYVLNFTQANTTWVYDINLQAWHERASFINGVYTRHRGQFHVFAFGKHLVGDYQTGSLYQQSLDINDYNGQPKRWMRTFPHLSDTLEYIYYHKLQVDMQTGVGLTSGGVQDTNPSVMLQWSDDGGHTWSNEHWVKVGKIGSYKQRALWRNLGRSRDRVFRLAGTANVKTFIIQGFADITIGTN